MSPFNRRLFLILLAFALVPSVLFTVVIAGSAGAVLPFMGSSAPWDSVAATGARALQAARTAPTGTGAEASYRRHEAEIASSVVQARRVRFLVERSVPLFVGAVVLLLALLAYGASRVAGHLSRQLSRPLDELVVWTERIANGEALPTGAPARGTPEFKTLREHMRTMAAALETSRTRALEAERLRAFRESARQVAHELKNPLTPIRFAVARLQQAAPSGLADAVEVLATETDRLDALARNFAQFGRLADGPAADVDLGDVVRYTARAVVPSDVPLTVAIADDVPLVHGQYDGLSRAVQNLLLNAVDACRERPGAGITVRLTAGATAARGPTVRCIVEDGGPGIPADRLAAIWEPYVTSKAGGTGLGLAIVRQTVLAHDGVVTATNRADGGAAIGFEIPVAGATRTATAS